MRATHKRIANALIGLALVGTLGAGAAACGRDDQPKAAAQAQPSAETQSPLGTLELSPASPMAGDRAKLIVNTPSNSGYTWESDVLFETWNGSAWTVAYILTGSTNQENPEGLRVLTPKESEGVFRGGGAIGGSGFQVVQMPDTAAGHYRLVKKLTNSPPDGEAQKTVELGVQFDMSAATPNSDTSTSTKAAN